MKHPRVDIVRAVCASAAFLALATVAGCGPSTPTPSTPAGDASAPAAAATASEPASAPEPPAPAQAPVAAEVPPAAPEGGAASASPAPAPTEAPAAPVKLGPIHKLTVTDLDGNPVSLAKFAGRPMIIEIWATWCGPCRVNRNNIHKMKSEFPERLLVIGVSYDMASGGGSTADLVKNFFKNNIANDHEFLATDEFRQFVNTRSTSNSIPKTMYVTSKGQVVDLSEGVQGAQWLRGMAKNLK
ncbi:MAG: TlpA family protein disulfide reductase [bacterium]